MEYRCQCAQTTGIHDYPACPTNETLAASGALGFRSFDVPVRSCVETLEDKLAAAKAMRCVLQSDFTLRRRASGKYSSTLCIRQDLRSGSYRQHELLRPTRSNRCRWWSLPCWNQHLACSTARFAPALCSAAPERRVRRPALWLPRPRPLARALVRPRPG